MKYVDSARRQIVMAVLLALAVIGALMREWAPTPSLMRDIGTLMLVLWVPAVGNLIAFIVRRLPRRAAKPLPAFTSASEFAGQLVVRVAPVEAQAALVRSLAADDRRCTVIVGTDGFTARTEMPLVELMGRTESQLEVALEFLRPSTALPRLQAGTHFYLTVDTTAIAQGTVVGPPIGLK